MRQSRRGGANAIQLFILLAGFVLYHLLHLTTGSAHPDFVHGSAYRNVINGFQQWPVSVVYILCMIPLGLHMYHGLWSMTQTLALDNRRVKAVRRPLAAMVALLVVVGNVSIPISVLTGFIR